MEMDLASLESVRDFAKAYSGPLAGHRSEGILGS